MALVVLSMYVLAPSSNDADSDIKPPCRVNSQCDNIDKWTMKRLGFLLYRLEQHYCCLVTYFSSNGLKTG